MLKDTHKCRLAPEGQKAVEGQKSQPLGAKATEGKPEGKPFIGPKRGSAVGSTGPFPVLLSSLTTYDKPLNFLQSRHPGEIRVVVWRANGITGCVIIAPLRGMVGGQNRLS